MAVVRPIMPLPIIMVHILRGVWEIMLWYGCVRDSIRGDIDGLELDQSRMIDRS
jgi:hypothetical protein